MEKTYENLRDEHQLVIICSRGILSEEEKLRVTSLLNSPELDWREVLYQALSHRTLNMLHYHLSDLNLMHLVEEEVFKLMNNQSQVFRMRNEAYKAELLSISEAFISEGIKTAVLKGTYLAYTVYPVMESRTFNDIDFLVNIKDGSRILDILTSAGYIQGDYDRNTFAIKPASRRQIVMHQMSTHEFQECLKPSKHPFVPLIQMDLNHDILWKGNCPYKVDTPELLDRAVRSEIDGRYVYVLTPEDCLLQLSCHLYKEAVMINWIHDLRDLKLYKFADFAVYIDRVKNIDWEIFTKRVKGYGLDKVVYFALYYVDYLYQVIPQEVMDALKPEDVTYLNEYAIETGTPKMWKMGFYERLFDSKHKFEVDKDILKTHDTFWEKRKQQ